MRLAKPKRVLLALLIATTGLGLTACSKDMSDLEAYVDDINKRPGGRIDPLPQVKPYASFAYAANSRRSPFVPESRIKQAQRKDTGLHPDTNRNPEYLESFPLDSLRMVGSLVLKQQTYALVQGGDGLIHRVQPGNYVGENDGRITSISDSEIKITEIVPDGLGGYLQRPAAIALSE